MSDANDTLSQEFEKQSKLLEDLLRRGRACQARARDAEERRRELSCGALASGFEIPKECESLSAEGQGAQREAADCEAAAERVQQRIADLRRQIEELRKNGTRSRLAESLELRESHVANINAAVQTILREIPKLDATDARLADEFGGLDARAVGIVTRLKNSNGNTSDLKSLLESLFLPEFVREKTNVLNAWHSELCRAAASLGVTLQDVARAS